MACKRSAVRSRYSPPKSTVLRWKYSAFLFAEVGFWGLHCFACTVFRLLQAVPIQPPTFDFTFHTSPGGDGPLLGANSPYSGCNAPDLLFLYTSIR